MEVTQKSINADFRFLDFSICSFIALQSSGFMVTINAPVLILEI